MWVGWGSPRLRDYGIEYLLEGVYVSPPNRREVSQIKTQVQRFVNRNNNQKQITKATNNKATEHFERCV